MIQLENVSRDYGDGKVVHALNNVCLEIDRGERVAVMGFRDRANLRCSI